MVPQRARNPTGLTHDLDQVQQESRGTEDS